MHHVVVHVAECHEILRSVLALVLVSDEVVQFEELPRVLGAQVLATPST